MPVFSCFTTKLSLNIMTMVLDRIETGFLDIYSRCDKPTLFYNSLRIKDVTPLLILLTFQIPTFFWCGNIYRNDHCNQRSTIVPMMKQLLPVIYPIRHCAFGSVQSACRRNYAKRSCKCRNWNDLPTLSFATSTCIRMFHAIR